MVHWLAPSLQVHGSLSAALHLSDRAADNIMQAVLAYLLIGSYGILFWQWRYGRGDGSAPAAAAAPAIGPGMKGA